MNNTCELIKQLREESGLTPTEFAKVMGVSKSSISKWENDKAPGIDHLYQIARYFRISVDELLRGQRNEESNFSLFISKYDLSEFDVPHLLKEANEKEIVRYFKKCQNIKDRFLKLLPRAAYRGLVDEDLEEFKYINKYIDIDSNVIRYEWDRDALLASELDSNKMAAIRDFLDRIKDLSKAEKEWEIEKIIYFTPKLYVDEIISLNMFEPFVEMYKTLPQIDKNSILNNTINRGEPINNIRNRYVLAMINNGGKILKTGWWHCTYWNDDVIKDYDGELGYSYRFKGSNYTESNYYMRNGDCSYSEYCSLIDEEKTLLFKEACYLRRTKPFEYYQRLKNGKFDNLLDY